MPNHESNSDSDPQYPWPEWAEVCTDQTKGLGAHVRFHYRSLPPGIWTTLAWRYGYHTWMELLGRDGEPIQSERLLVWGVYEGRHQEGPKEGKHDGTAQAKWMIWEYEEDGGLERWGNVKGRTHGFVDHLLPEFSESDYQIMQSMVYDGLVLNLGPYGYLLPWLGPVLGVWNCQRYVRVYCRTRGGPKGLFHDLGRRFWNGD